MKGERGDTLYKDFKEYQLDTDENGGVWLVGRWQNGDTIRMFVPYHLTERLAFLLVNGCGYVGKADNGS